MKNRQLLAQYRCKATGSYYTQHHRVIRGSVNATGVIVTYGSTMQRPITGLAEARADGNML